MDCFTVPQTKVIGEASKAQFAKRFLDLSETHGDVCQSILKQLIQDSGYSDFDDQIHQVLDAIFDSYNALYPDRAKTALTEAHQQDNANYRLELWAPKKSCPCPK